MVDAPDGPTVAILPARGGSKRIFRKNIKPFLGVPIIARTIDRLLEAELFDDVVVSTDDDEVAAVAQRAGASVPFRRPDSLSGDHVGTESVISHAIETLEGQLGNQLHLVCAVYPTSVLVRSADLQNALELLKSEDVDYVFAGTTFPYPIQRALRILSDGSCQMLHPEHLQTRSQDLETAYHDAGQFYWGRRSAWMETRNVFVANSHLYLIPRHRVQDIDTPEDWQRAELLFQLIGESHDLDS